MQDNQKRSHFAKFHERVLRKYEEMQHKIQKSKSEDCLLTTCDDAVFHFDNIKHLDGTDSSTNLSIVSDAEPNSKRESILVEEVESKNASYEDISIYFTEETEEAFQSVEPCKISEISDDINENNDNISYDRRSQASFESLSGSKESVNSLASPSPTPRISLRDRIHSRLHAAKEKRRIENAAKEKSKKVHKHVLSNSMRHETTRVTKRIKTATVTVALIEVNGLNASVAADSKMPTFYCRFRLDVEKYKSKLIKTNCSKIQWLELFNLNLYEDNMLELTLHKDKDMLVGRKVIDLSKVEKEKTHKMRLKLDESPDTEILILLTITGTPPGIWDFDIDDFINPSKQIEYLNKKYESYQREEDTGNVGCLLVIVYGALGLNGNDCYCVLELCNERLQTHTEFKTSDPNWMKCFTFQVNDITSVLEVTVWDEKKSEDIGKIYIPLLDIRNGEKKWYALKDSVRKERAKGNNPRILLEMRLRWNLLKGSLRVLNPKDSKYLKEEEKLDRHLFSKNLARAKVVVAWVYDAFKIIKTCFEWDSRKLNIIALSVWLVTCWFFKIWMVPLLFLIPFIWYRPQKYYLIDWYKYMIRFKIINEKDSEELQIVVKDKTEKEEKTSFRQKLLSLQEMVQSVQNFIGKVASFGERVKNLYNFTVPFLSCLGIFFILAITLVIHLVPLKVIFMIWGIHKFTRKILRPNRIPNNEVLDFLSRVPDDEQLLDSEQLPLESAEDKVIIIN